MDRQIETLGQILARKDCEVVNIVMCMNDYRWGLDWQLDLLNSYRSQIQLTTASRLILTLDSSLQHVLSLLSSIHSTSGQRLPTPQMPHLPCPTEKVRLLCLPSQYTTQLTLYSSCLQHLRTESGENTSQKRLLLLCVDISRAP
jgi:cysteinyl-tRNA synthetase